MLTLEIEQSETHYRLPRSLLNQRSRLERVFQTMIDHCLANALERAGIDPAGELCLREIRVPVHLRWSESDDELARAWSLSFASSVHAALLQGGGDWVMRYESRPAALVHFATALADGDVTLAWSWRQLFFPAYAVPTSLPVATERLVQTLLRQPEQIVPVVRETAARGRLGPLLDRLSEDQWVELIEAALCVAGASGLPRGWWSSSSIVVADRRRRVEKSAAASSSPAADRVALAPRAATMVRSLPQSRIGRAASELPAATLAPRVRAGLALLAALELEPACMLADSAILHQIPALLAAVLFEGGAAAATAAFERAREPQVETEPALAPSSPGAQRSAAGHDDTSPDTLAAATTQRQPAKDPAVKRRPENSKAETVRATQPTGRTEPSAESTPLALDNDVADSVRQRALTEAGGLLLLIHVIDQLEIPQAAMAGGERSVFVNRSLRWVLHQLALLLAGVEPGDPAALALAGLAPGARPPSLDSAAPAPAELTELQRMCDAILQATRQRLLDFDAARRGREAGCQDGHSLADDQPLDWLIHRPARLEADPGWIAAYFDLRDVSTEVRGAGLDLDPGYVPWLGVVIKFHYE